MEYTQRVMDLDVHFLHLCALVINVFAKFCWNVLVELFLDKICNSRFNRPVDLSFDLTGVKNQYCKHIEQTLLTFFVEVLQHLGVQCLFQKFCRKNSDSHPPLYAVLTFDLILLVRLGRCQ